jgi:hypothetical protein
VDEPIPAACRRAGVETRVAVGPVTVVAIFRAVLDPIAAMRGQHTTGCAFSCDAVIGIVVAVVALLSGIDYSVAA